MIYKGYILEISQGGQRAKVKALGGRIFENLLILHPYGESSFMESDNSSLCWVFMPTNGDENSFCIPYNVPLQPELKQTEKVVGNFKTGNKVTFKANGDIELAGTNDFLAQTIENFNINASTKITLNAPAIGLGDELGLVLNDQAAITDSVGGACVITSPGQTKVTA